MGHAKAQADEEVPWAFYLYVAQQLLHWDFDFFYHRVTPAFWLQSYVVWLQANNPDAIDQTAGITYTPDQVPLYR